MVAAFTGLRASELRGLRWEDVDLKKNELHVRQRADRYNEIGSPKSEDSERTVPFGGFVANTLKEWKLKHPGKYVFGTDKDTVVEHSNLVKASIIPAARPQASRTPACIAFGISMRAGASTGECRGRSFRNAWGILVSSSLWTPMATYSHGVTMQPRSTLRSAMSWTRHRRDMLAKR